MHADAANQKSWVRPCLRLPRSSLSLCEPRLNYSPDYKERFSRQRSACTDARKTAAIRRHGVDRWRRLKVCAHKNTLHGISLSTNRPSFAAANQVKS